MNNILKLPHRQIPQLIPEELLKKTAICPLCKSQSLIPWLEKMKFPKQPIKSSDGGGYWVPADIPMQCSNLSCQHTFSIGIPTLPNESLWNLYGDEAGRYIKDPSKKHSTKPLNFFCITLVGLHRNRQDRVRNQILKLKKSIRPSEDPDSWTHHFTEIWGSNSTTGKFHLKNKTEKIIYAKKFAKIIREARPEMVTFNISDCILAPSDAIERKKVIKSQKEGIFCQSILTTLDISRINNKNVKWTFDNIQDTTEKNRVEGWADECFLGLQYSRLFTWLSAGAPVEGPVFVPPGSHFLLEIADFISYCVARDFEKSVLGEQAEFPSSLLGKGFFQGTLGNGDAEKIWNFGLPLKKFYGL